jgi:transcription initiation factor TFIIB
LIVAAVYAACRDLAVPRTLEEISVAANTDSIFAGKCYRLLVQNLELKLPVIDSNKYLARIANKAKVSEKTYRTGLDMLSKIKSDPISHGKDPNALAVAVLYAACLNEGENVSQAQVAVAGDISIVTLRKRFQDVRKIFPS